MNCRQTRVLLAIYRELKLNQTDMHILETHLSQCAACKEVQAQYAIAGDMLQTLPRLDLLPDAHTKLMQALATEHVHFLQYTPASTVTTPTPAFLAPYLKDLAQGDPYTNKLAAFATADTSPIPIIPQLTKRRPIYHINHFTIIGVAASFLMTLLVGSLTSLLLLTQHGSSISPPSLVVHQLNDVRSVNYLATPVYPHVASAVASNYTIYYTTYNDDETSWQLEQFDEKANSTTPLLPKPSTQELIVLGSSANWLIWLQIDPPKPANSLSQPTHDTSITPTRLWSLHAHYLGSTPSTGTGMAPFDRELISKMFDPSTVPNWVHRPIQGISFIQNTLLAAIIDTQGISHLQSFQLDPTKEIIQTELANASKGHLLTSPTANSNGTAIYWADEYIPNADDQINSDVWTQQTIDGAPANAGHWIAHQTIKQYPFRADGKSFHPQMVNDTLFLLSTSQTAENTPHASPDVTPLVTASTQARFTTTSIQPSVVPATANYANPPESVITLDPKIFTPQIDSTQVGRILSFTASGATEVLPQFDNTQSVTALQGGTGFLLWQTTDGSNFGMYDVIAKAPVEVGDNVFPPNTAFPAINEDTAVSVVSSHDQVNGHVTFDTFRWPMPRS